MKQSEAEDWLKQKIDALRNHKDFHGQPEGILWKRALAEEWKQAPDRLKPKLLELIKKKWQELNIDWDYPNGKAARKARNIFEAWIRKNS